MAYHRRAPLTYSCQENNWHIWSVIRGELVLEKLLQSTYLWFQLGPFCRLLSQKAHPKCLPTFNVYTLHHRHVLDDGLEDISMWSFKCLCFEQIIPTQMPLHHSLLISFQRFSHTNQSSIYMHTYHFIAKPTPQVLCSQILYFLHPFHLWSSPSFWADSNGHSLAWYYKW